MRFVIFLFGVLTGLAFSRLPHYAVFNDQPPTPTDWKPKIRHWVNGEEVTV